MGKGECSGGQGGSRVWILGGTKGIGEGGKCVWICGSGVEGERSEGQGRGRLTGKAGGKGWMGCEW